MARGQVRNFKKFWGKVSRGDVVLTYECRRLAGVHVNVLGLLLGNHEAEQLLHTEGGLVAPPRQQRGLHRGSRARCNNRGNCLTISCNQILHIFARTDAGHYSHSPRRTRKKEVATTVCMMSAGCSWGLEEGTGE